MDTARSAWSLRREAGRGWGKHLMYRLYQDEGLASKNRPRRKREMNIYTLGLTASSWAITH